MFDGVLVHVFHDAFNVEFGYVDFVTCVYGSLCIAL